MPASATPPSAPLSASRFLGSLLGLMTGDSLGAPFEGISSDHVYWTSGPIGPLLDGAGDPLAYTDDTQMMIGVAEALLEDGCIDRASLVRAFARNYQAERGYGPSAARILEAIVAGEPWETLPDTLLPGGSFGNGAAMRVAPIGLLFAHDLDRVSEEARKSAWPTHRHPLGIEGAQLLALAVALAARSERFERQTFYDELLARSQSDEFRWQLEAARDLRQRHTRSFLGNSLPAQRSVVAAIACFTCCPRSYRDAIERAIALGDDTDTLAAMAGAISGACLGVEAIPDGWLSRLERTPQGCDYVRALAVRLHDAAATLRQGRDFPAAGR